MPTVVCIELISVKKTDADRPLFRQIAAWFEANGWKYQEHLLGGDYNFLSTEAKRDNGTWKLFARTGEEVEWREVFFWSKLEMLVPEGRRNAVAEFITRSNFGHRIGFFQMSFFDGELSYHISFTVADGTLADGQVAHAVNNVLFSIDRYYPGLMEVIYGGRDPQEAWTALINRDLA